MGESEVLAYFQAELVEKKFTDFFRKDNTDPNVTLAYTLSLGCTRMTSSLRTVWPLNMSPGTSLYCILTYNYKNIVIFPR